MRYVALGDSYSIGTSVAEHERWPNQLVARLADAEEPLELVGNLGVNGHTSGDLIREQLPRLARLRPEMASVLIGVNDVVQGRPEEEYGAHASQILDTILMSMPATRVFGVATPDYTMTPQGDAFGVPELQSAGIARNNQVLAAACDARGVVFVPDIFEISRALGNDRSMLATDGLHPSGAQYAHWVDAIEPVVRGLLALPSDD
jgi:lysophospholipase L1-like esterase